jgi:aryl-alcohol dehydrogenase-like predicted oxidoreductase
MPPCYNRFALWSSQSGTVRDGSNTWSFGAGEFNMFSQPSRRSFLQAGMAVGVFAGLQESLLAAQTDDGAGIPKRPLGNTGAQVSILCLGGWHIGQAGKDDGEQAAIQLMHQAIDNGITFFDNCWDYHDGFSEELMGKAIHDRRDKVFLMTKVCNRDYEGAKANLADSLRRLQTDHLDLWQFHEMVYDNDPDWVFEKGGIRAAIEAQQAGKVRFIGFTGHKDPSIHLKMLNKPQAWASAQMPINICDFYFRSFLHQVVPQCLQRNVGVLGMKSLGGGVEGKIPASGKITAESCLNFSLSQPVSSLVTGLRNERDLNQALKVARDFQPLPFAEQLALLEQIKPEAGDGRHELFKTSKTFDGPYHREQHGFAVNEA